MELASDCARCEGLCCAAMAFTRGGGFGHDKPADTPCHHLTPAAGCGIHAELRERGYPSCTVFECFGAGQQVVQVTYAGRSWREHPDLAAEVFAVFRALRGVHEVAAAVVAAAAAVRTAGAGPLAELEAVAAELAALDAAPPAVVLATDLDALRGRAGDLLGRASRAVRGGGQDLSRRDLLGAELSGRDLDRADLRGALLVAADLRGASLRLTDLLGADLRDADVRGTDLADALFVTQPQVNAARGDDATVLPAHLDRPAHWA
ncbi:pentapeptide repeat-containing protein [Nocardioides sp. SYSU D00038]|uniref:pentapeptide repeat-containing protein n=1 Tax=Nocardioides sp. SYSU D00038 TaxID=2812554 RepID=UPI0027DB68EE|nr:pentapeptide repeat-containing protein [Nocardioides sp. SYSU D00038]